MNQAQRDEMALGAAFHEAGHAIAIERLGGFVKKVEVNFTGAGGVVDYVPPGDERLNAIVTGAGAVATARFYQVAEGYRVSEWLAGKRPDHAPPEWAPLTVSPSDERPISDYLRQFARNPEVRSIRKKELAWDTERLVRDNWQIIDKTVQALIAKVDRNGRASLTRDEFLKATGLPDNDPLTEIEKRRKALPQ